MSNMHMKRCSPSFTFKEMHIRTTVRYHITPTRVALIKMTSVGGDVEKLEPSCIVGRSINGAAAFKQFVSSPFTGSRCELSRAKTIHFYSP